MHSIPCFFSSVYIHDGITSEIHLYLIKPLASVSNAKTYFNNTAKLTPDQTAFVYFFHKQIPLFSPIIGKQIAFVN